MKARKLSSERGQAIVLVALGFVVLLGFAALAVDGSMVYADRRFAQNAADAASLAGGSEAAIRLENAFVSFDTWNCGGQDMNNAIAGAIADAIDRASDNGYVIDTDLEDPFDPGVDDGGVTTECIDGANDRYLDVHTRVSTQTDTAFMHFVYSGQMVNTVDAVTRVRPRQNATFGHAIIALNPANCSGNTNGATYHGTADVIVHGGGVFSNGCLRGVGNVNVTVEDGPVNYVEQLIGGGHFSPAPETGTSLDPEDFWLPDPDCSHPDAWNGSGSQLLNASPLAPGLYCVSGALRINGNDSLIGDGVTIFLVDGNLRINGNAEVQISAPAASPDPSPAVAGMLIMLPHTNASDIQINGNSTSYFHGTILAPGSDIDALGTGNTDAYQTQIIGWNVQAGGTADMDVTYQGNDIFLRPTYLELAR